MSELTCFYNSENVQNLFEFLYNLTIVKSTKMRIIEIARRRNEMDTVWYEGIDGGRYFDAELREIYFDDPDSRIVPFWVWINERGFKKIN